MKVSVSDDFFGRSLVLGLGLLLLLLRFPDFFQTPNSHVIEPYADGFKAYTNIEYHARHDSSYTYFQAMNYPYGDHAAAAVTQPLFSSAIKLISDYVVDITGYTRAILHASLLLGILLAAFFLYLILCRLGSVWWFAALAALGIAFLSPQIYRFQSHYGLAHLEVFPILFYLLLRLEEAHSLKYSLWIAVTLFVFPLIHFYYFAIMVMLVSLYFFFGFLRKPSGRRLLRYILHYSVQVGPPLVFFYFWMYHGNTISDRASRPWGFFEYKAIWENMVTSLAMPYFQWIDQSVIPIQQGSFEGQAYIGLVALISLLVLTVRWARSGMKAPFIRVGGDLQPFLSKLFWASGLLLLLSMGLPFVIPGLEGLLEYTGPYKQFRSVGRFNWPFYYAINLIAFAELGAWMKTGTNRWRLGLGIAALLLLGFEAYRSATAPDLRLDEVKELQAGYRYTDIPGIDFREFQAVLPVPYFNIGSENFWYEADGLTMPRTLLLGVQTGLPTTGAALTRTSRGQTIKQLQLINEPYRRPLIFEDFPNDKPLLMLVNSYKYSQEQARYEHLMEGAQLLFDNEHYSLFRLPLSVFEDRIAARVRDIEYRLNADSASLLQAGLFLSPEPSENFFYESFDSLSTPQHYRGGGAYQGDAADKNVLFDGQLPKQYGGGWYTFSAWVFIDADRVGQSWAHIEEYEPESGTVIKQQSFPLFKHLNVFDTNGWALLELPFIPERSESQLRFWIQHKELKGQPLYVDELLIRHSIAELFRRGEGYVFKNNRWYETQ